MGSLNFLPAFIELFPAEWSVVVRLETTCTTTVKLSNSTRISGIVLLVQSIWNYSALWRVFTNFCPVTKNCRFIENRLQNDLSPEKSFWFSRKRGNWPLSKLRHWHFSPYFNHFLLIL